MGAHLGAFRARRAFEDHHRHEDATLHRRTACRRGGGRNDPERDRRPPADAHARLRAPKVGQLPRFPTIKVENARQVYFTEEEFDRLVKALPEEIATSRDPGNDWLIPFVIADYWTGARRNELLRLERRQLALEAAKISLPPGSTKNKEGWTFYLPAPALEALKEWDAKTRALERDRGIIVRHVFHRRGRSPITESRMASSMALASAPR
jgi:integrase